MKRRWQIRRHLKPCLDGQQRWDRAYQYLLRWTSTEWLAQTDVPGALNPSQEVDDAHSHLCPRVDSAPGARPDD